MPEIEVSRAGGVESAIRKMKRVVESNIIPKQLRDNERYIKPAEKRKREKEQAKRRYKKKAEKELLVKESYKQSNKLSIARKANSNKNKKRRKRADD
jgi:small subunit ribosomal protein S21